MLPRSFNLLHCVNPDPFEVVLAASSPEEHAKTFDSSPRLYHFIELEYIWPFTNVLDWREDVMSRTWERVRHNYTGIDVG